MKRSLRNIGLFCIMLFYGFTVSYYSIEVISSKIAFADEQQANDKSYFSFISSNLFCNTIHPKSLVYGSNDVPTTFYKKHNNNFLSGSNNAAFICVNSFAKYQNQSETIEIQFRKTDIVFPFHDFL